jgi:uncharacterized protein YjiS (DUF1127 family)
MRGTRSCIAAIHLLQCTMAAYFIAHIESPAWPAHKKGTKTMLLAIIRFLQIWKRYNASLRELSRLGDRELADIGITRGDIPRIAWDNAHG